MKENNRNKVNIPPSPLLLLFIGMGRWSTVGAMVFGVGGGGKQNWSKTGNVGKATGAQGTEPHQDLSVGHPAAEI